MTLLLDTHVFLWWYLASPELSAEVRSHIASPANDVLVSAAVAWEIVIKRALGRLEFSGTVEDAITGEGFASLPIRTSHADTVATLASHHGDPFDRIQIAQAIVEQITLVTHDSAILRYRGFARLRA